MAHSRSGRTCRDHRVTSADTAGFVPSDRLALLVIEAINRCYRTANHDHSIIMRSILVPVDFDGAMRAALDTALLLARLCDSYIEGFTLRARTRGRIGADVEGALLLQAADEQDFERSEIEARHIFLSYMYKHGVPQATATTGALSFGWRENVADRDTFVGRHGRVFDVIVMNWLDRNRSEVHGQAIISALFESGRPILLAPPTPPPQIATNVLIPWNCSAEQARVTALAIPLLQKADQITVLTITAGTEVSGPSADQFVRYLRRNQILAELKAVELGGKSTGETILGVAELLGCDLLIKGAFTRSRLRQMIFGGATRHVIENATLPVLLAN